MPARILPSLVAVHKAHVRLHPIAFEMLTYWHRLVDCYICPTVDPTNVVVSATLAAMYLFPDLSRIHARLGLFGASAVCLLL